MHLTTIDNNNPKLNVTRIRDIEMAHSYNVIFVKVLITLQYPKNMILIKHVLYQSDFDHPDKLKNLVSETWNTAFQTVAPQTK